MPEIVAIQFDPERDDDGVMCQLDDGRVFVTLRSEIGKYAEAGDEDALPAFNRAWTHNPRLFNGPVKPRVPVIVTQEVQGLHTELSERDRMRLHRIIDKYWRAYFATFPTPAQKDNLIDGLGARVAAKIVKKTVDRGDFR